MKTTLFVLQIVVSVLLLAAILVQQKGSGLGMAFGGGSTIYRTKRGAEKIIFRGTIVLAVLFLIVSFAQLLIP